MSNDPVVQILREAYQREKEIAAAPKDSIQSCAQRGGRPRSRVITRKQCKVVAAAQVKNGVGDVLSTPFLGRTDFYSWVTRTSRTTLPTMARVTAGSLDASSARRGRWWAPAPHVVFEHEKDTAPDLRSPAPSGHGIVTPRMTTGPSV